MRFEISTWYDTWNNMGLQNLVQKLVPLDYATRYNLAFGEFVSGANGYTVDLNAPYAGQVQAQIQAQAPGVLVYAGVGDTGLAATVQDNNANNNRSTANIVNYLQQHGLQGNQHRLGRRRDAVRGGAGYAARPELQDGRSRDRGLGALAGQRS